MLEGFAKNILSRLYPNISLPHYSIICRRAAELEEQLPKLSSRRPQVVLIDATGIKVYGEGEWKVKVHGKTKQPTAISWGVTNWNQFEIDCDQQAPLLARQYIFGSSHR